MSFYTDFQHKIFFLLIKNLLLLVILLRIGFKMTRERQERNIKDI